jgi:hypothetical protein
MLEWLLLLLHYRFLLNQQTIMTITDTQVDRESEEENFYLALAWTNK